MQLQDLYILFLCLNFLTSLSAQTGSIHEPVRYLGGQTIDPALHEGRLRYAVGVESRQTIRVNRTDPGHNDNLSWTYSHASNLAYWNGRFYQQYLSNPVDEHIPPGRTLLTTSNDGRSWEEPTVIFPHYEPPPGVTLPDSALGYMMHQRMGFYVAPDNRLLLLAFYGHAEDPFTTGGIGRVVREIYPDHTLGPIYFIRYDSHTDWDQSNTSFPFYQRSPDKGFIAACDSLLRDPLMTLQWWDEDHGLDGFYQVKEAGEALSYYHRDDGKVVALWKRSHAALSEDEGVTFSSPVKVPTLTMAGGKVWGQRTDDNRYAMVYNPIELDEYRYPLIVISGDDGIHYDNMLLVNGEVPPRRFMGRWKDFGPCYVRGIVEGNGNPPGEDFWLTYSMNKEDIWVSRVPLPIRSSVSDHVQDDFENLPDGDPFGLWNIYAPKWAAIEVHTVEGNNKVLQLQDEDPYDYARAIRIFPESQLVEVSLDITPQQSDHGHLEIDITDQFGNRPVRIAFNPEGKILACEGSTMKTVGDYQSGHGYHMLLMVDATPGGKYSLLINDHQVLQDAPLAVSVKSVERISLRTGPYRDLPNRNTPNQEEAPPLPGADEKVEKAIFLVDDVVTRSP